MELRINNSQLNVNNACKYLGMIIDNKLDFNIHIQALVETKLSRSVVILSKLQHVLPLSTLRTLYFALIHSYLLYELLIWGSVLKSRLNKVIILQNKALRIITKGKFRDQLQKANLETM